MHFSKIEAATAPSLFDVYTDCSSMIGPKPGPRQAVDSEIYAYAAWLAFKAGMMPREAREIIGYGYRLGQRRSSPCKGVTYGKKGDWNNESRAHDYEPGSYSVPFPGRNAHRDTVTMETLDDAGNVIASSTLPVEPKKGGVIWDKATVHKAVGKVTKPSRGKVAAPLSAEIDDKDENPVAETQEQVAMVDDAPVGVALLSAPEIAPAEPSSNPCQLPAPGLADQVAALAAMVEKLRVMRTNLERGTDALDMMTERALRAENALRALEQRRERADGPYRVNVGPVSFRAAA